ncbi:nascent polypeptide-associated complex protein [Sulfuracidifex tepidarius]|uniref:Nascent polypeptide-associated complex protein n=1 Tax=Sulfuracidifex tepidarius TaxID=1294262 RepID=A0A510E335_9CREN|nr:nascent polypeptide-associated complex protein [Sulfuracidifex tepidarius]BBG24174.1 Nascent polypeptide-associated complex protein [Sulfuracidifex tepidarius]BBG26931.1 Nascent polypeptide-associated complex protein [Sulfuracidifex tepidarius]
MKIRNNDLKKLEKMGIKPNMVNATRVIIETAEGERIVIEGCQVTKMVAQGNSFYTIIGGEERKEEIKEGENKGEVSISEDDVKFLMEQTGKGENEVRDALVKSGGDIAKALASLTGETS